MALADRNGVGWHLSPVMFGVQGKLLSKFSVLLGYPFPGPLSGVSWFLWGNFLSLLIGFSRLPASSPLPPVQDT